MITTTPPPTCRRPSGSRRLISRSASPTRRTPRSLRRGRLVHGDRVVRSGCVLREQRCERLHGVWLTVTMVGAGTCSITASQAGSDDYNAATDVTQTFGIAKADQTINFTDPSDTTFAPAGTVSLTASATSGLNVSFASNSTGVCTVSGLTVAMVGAGTCSITASQAGSDNYNAATDVTQTFGSRRLISRSTSLTRRTPRSLRELLVSRRPHPLVSM